MQLRLAAAVEQIEQDKVVPGQGEMQTRGELLLPPLNPLGEQHRRGNMLRYRYHTVAVVVINTGSCNSLHSLHFIVEALCRKSN